MLGRGKDPGAHRQLQSHEPSTSIFPAPFAKLPTAPTAGGGGGGGARLCQLRLYMQ